MLFIGIESDAEGKAVLGVAQLLEDAFLPPSIGLSRHIRDHLGLNIGRKFIKKHRDRGFI